MPLDSDPPGPQLRKTLSFWQVTVSGIGIVIGAVLAGGVAIAFTLVGDLSRVAAVTNFAVYAIFIVVNAALDLSALPHAGSRTYVRHSLIVGQNPRTSRPGQRDRSRHDDSTRMASVGYRGCDPNLGVLDVGCSSQIRDRIDF